MTTMADLDDLALAMPEATKEVSDDGRPSYHVHGKMFCFQRGRRPDALDPETGERMDDVLMFRVADLEEKKTFSRTIAACHLPFAAPDGA